MSHLQFGTVFRRWLYGMSGQPTADLPDGQLLERFLHERDEAAFETLVHRHGSLVLGVCTVSCATAPAPPPPTPLPTRISDAAG